MEIISLTLTLQEGRDISNTSTSAASTIAEENICAPFSEDHGDISITYALTSQEGRDVFNVSGSKVAEYIIRDPSSEDGGDISVT